MKHSILLSMATLGIVVCGSIEARADCNSSSACESIINSGTGAALVAAGTGAGISISGGRSATSYSGTGVYGVSYGGYGVQGYTTTGTAGVYGIGGSSSGSNGVQGITTSPSASGVYGENDSSVFGGYGVVGRISGIGGGYAVYGDNVGGWAVYAHGDLQVTGTPNCTGCTAFTNNSDLRLKKNVQTLVGALDRLVQLRGVTFEWKDPEEHGNRAGTQRGFIAQEVEKVMPEWVGVDTKGFKTLNLTGLEPMVVESLRALKLENDALSARVKALENGRRTSISGFAGGGLAGVAAFLMMGSAIFISHRKRFDTRA